MLEFLIALLIFSMGMMGLLSAQLAGKKAGFEASQRSVATALARDILERMRANSAQITSYRLTTAGDVSDRLAPPDADCAAVTCSAEQLAVFDVWQWESLLWGDAEKDSGGNTGGLASPRACITSAGGEVAVTITWLGATAARQAAAFDCDSDDVQSDDAQSNVASGDADHNTRRQQLTITTFIGEHR